MTWLAWRQFRLQGAVVYALLGALVVALAIVSLPDVPASDLIRVLSAGDGAATVYSIGVLAILALPAIVGVFWGAPLVARELEAGTHRLAWTQSISRTRWLATKVGLVGLAAVAGAGVVSALVSWWCGPIDDALNAGALAGQGFLEATRMHPLNFPARGIVPIGYTAFAFALGVTAGTLVRRTVPAMAITLGVFVAVQVAVPTVRAQLGPSERMTTITAENLRALAANPVPPGEPMGPVRYLTVAVDEPGAWLIANETLERGGNVADSLPSWVIRCVPMGERGSIAGRDPDCFARLEREGYRQRVTYMPASRYWTLQAYETVAFLLLAGALLGGTFWWIRNRVS